MVPSISVIIPMYNAENRIGRLIESIYNQEGVSQDDYEVIAIDNMSTDNTVKLLESLKKKYPLIVGSEKKRSSYAARNRGIMLARGRYLVFIDADCNPSKHWLRGYIDCIKKIESSGEKEFLIAGDIEVVVSSNRNIWEIYDKIHYLNQKIFVQKGFGATANLLVTCGVFDQVGPFDSRFVSGGDSEFGKRATEKFKIYFCPEAKVYHNARSTLRGLLRKSYRVGIGFSQQRIKKTGRGIPWHELIRYLFPDIGFLRPEYFPKFVPQTQEEIPEDPIVRIKLLYIDQLVRIMQFLGRMYGNSHGLNIQKDIDERVRDF